MRLPGRDFSDLSSSKVSKCESMPVKSSVILMLCCKSMNI